MKIFGSVYPFVESGDASLRLGRHVANYEFLKALLRRGTFDEYHLFCLSTGHLRTTMARIRAEPIPDEQKRKVRLLLIHYLIDNLTSKRYHVFHLGGWGYFFPGLVYLRNAHARHRFPITGLIHSLNGIETPYHGFKLCAAPLLPFDTIVCSSEAGRTALLSSLQRVCAGITRTGGSMAFGGRTAIIPLGVDDALTGAVERERCRGEWDLPTTASVVVSVGRISPRTKADPYPLLHGFRMLVDRNPDRELVLIMAGGVSAAEQRLVGAMIRELGLEGSVRIAANFDTSRKRSLYAAADLCLALSDNLQETFGISVIEAMAAGVPVVASDLDGYKELFEHGVEGFKVPTRWLGELGLCELADIMNFDTMQLALAQCMAVDTEAAVGFMQKLFDDPALARRMGEAGRKRVEKRYGWSRVIAAYERLWDRLADEAEAFEGPVRAETNPFMNDYPQTFRHYPSALLADEDRCRLSRGGQTAVVKGRLPSPYSDIAPLADMRLVMAMLRRLAEGDRTVRELIDEPSWASAGPDRIRYGLLWAAKYSLVGFGR